MPYVCPFPNCKFEAENWSNLKKHVATKHKSDVCPACGRRYRFLVRHLERMSHADERHAVRSVQRKEILDRALHEVRSHSHGVLLEGLKWT